ncbi:MAG: FtsH protease activity modulator HflK, partial [Plesiomonas shigelloides]
GFYTIKEAERGVVTRLGKYDRIVQPGLNWKPTFIESVTPVNVEAVRELPASGFMLTQDENVVRVEMNVQYKVADPAKYLFSVSNPDDSLRQATDSALRYVVGHTKMDEVLTRGRAKVRQDTWVLLDQIIAPYNMGLQVLDVNFQSARPPEEVKEAFDDAIAAQEDEQRFIREAEAYAREVEPKARGNVKRVEEEAQAYKERVILEAKGDADRFNALLPEYQAAPKVTRERMYLDTMEKVLSNSNKVLVDTNANNVLMLPTDSLMKKDGAQSAADAAAAAVSVPSLNEIGRNSGTYNSTEGQGQDSRTNVNSQDRQGRF